MTLGFLDPEMKYSADAGTWADALLQIRPMFESSYPDLFSGFGFRESIRAKPYSREVSEFLTHMQLALAVGVGNPEFKVLTIKPGAQQDLLHPYELDRRYERALKAAKELAHALAETHLVEASSTSDS